MTRKRPEPLNPVEAAERQRSMILRLVRVTFFALIVTFALLAVFRFREYPEVQGLAIKWWLPVGAGLFIFALAIGVDLLTPQKKLSTFSGVFFGVTAGMLATVVLGFIIDLLLRSWVDNDKTIDELQPVVNSIKILMAVSLCYLGVSTVLQTQDEFRLVIPYVEFVKQVRGVRPLLLDTSALIDARAADLAAAGAFQAPLVIPRFVLDELQALADSSDALKRAKGRRGLEVVTRLQRLPRADVAIDERSVQAVAVDQMLVETARSMPATVVTVDTGLARVCGIQGVPVLNINEIATALRPSYIPGESLSVRLIRTGEQPGQGVGYLPDGTMVVAEDGAASIGSTVTLTVQTSLQTAAGRLIFARINEAATAAAPLPLPASNPAPTPPEREQPGGEETVAGAEEPARAERSPFPPKSPRSIRDGTPRNPRR